MTDLSIYPDSARTRKSPLRIAVPWIPLDRMIRPGFLEPESHQDLIELARDASAAHLLARRANTLVLLDDGMNCEAIGQRCSWTMTRSACGSSCIKKTELMVWPGWAIKAGSAA